MHPFVRPSIPGDRRGLESGMAEGLKQALAKPIQLADQITRSADEAQTFRPECLELKSKTERLANLLRQGARADLYERPTRRIMNETEKVLDNAHFLVAKCRDRSLLSRVFPIIPAGAFKKMSAHLDNSIGDVSWLLRVSKSNRNGNNDGNDDDDDDGYLGLPPIASNEPILGLIWEQIAKLHTGSVNARAAAAAYLLSCARDNARYVKIIVEEGGIPPLLKLVKEGSDEAQESAARALGLIGRDPDSIEVMIQFNAGSVFANALKAGPTPMKVQSAVAWTVSELAAHHRKYQDTFAQNNAVRYLVSHIAFETVQEHSKYSHHPKATSIHHVVVAKNNSLIAATSQGSLSSSRPPLGNVNPAETNAKGWDSENPETKATMKSMAARALCYLARDNASICKSIAESKALRCFAVLLDSGHKEVRLYSAKALLEIARVAEQVPELRRSAFNPTSPAAKAVIDHLLRVVEKGEYSDLLVPSIASLGCLSRTFRASENRILPPLVRLIDDREPEVMREALFALTSFACPENCLHLDHSKAIVAAGGVKHLVQLVYFADQQVQLPALVLLCHIASDVPDSEDLAQAEVLNLLEWASKQNYMANDPSIGALLQKVKLSLELFQARGTGGFH